MAEVAAEVLRDMGGSQGHLDGGEGLSGTPATQAAQPGRSVPLPPDGGAGAADADQELTARQLSHARVVVGVKIIDFWNSSPL